ncbi:glutathione S-transferase family protein [Vibrio profundum]|uniref:glutathione S-transferase family protein n=1 Tax=Vibrio profundum TaxID=2910247 RepID=UPI003D0C2351
MLESVHIVGPQYSSFVRSVMLCCEEKGIHYSVGFNLRGKRIAFQGEEHLRLHPFGKVPMILHGTRSLFETASICRYLDDEFLGPKLQPSNIYSRALVDQWSSAISGYIYDILAKDYLLELSDSKRDAGEIDWNKVERSTPRVEKALTILHQQLANHSCLCGDDYTIADALLTPLLDYLAKLPHADDLLSPFPELSAYLTRMRKRSSAKQVLI